MGTKTSTRRLNYTFSVQNYYTGAIINFDNFIVVTNHHSGVDDPKYKDKIARGYGAANTFYAYKQRVVWQGGKVSFKRKSAGIGYSEWMFVPSALPTGFDATLLADAKNKAAIGIRKRIKQEETSVSGGVMLGEMRETVHMIRHPAESIKNLLTKFVVDHEQGLKRARKQRIANARRKSRGEKEVPGYVVKNGTLRASADTIASSWLELVFGLEPLMSDIAAIAETALSSYSTPRIKRLQFTAQAASASTSVSDVLPPNSVVWTQRTQDYTDEVSCRYSVGYRETISGVQEGWRKVIDHAGFNLREIVPTAWELLPWSFLIDYVSNIGDVIESNAVSMRDVAWSYLTTRRNGKLVVSTLCSKGWMTPDTSAYYDLLPGHDALSSSSIVEVKREAASIPYGELRFSLPEKDGHFKNLAALLWLQLKF